MTLREIAFHDEVFHLYNSVGWSAYTKDRETLEKGFEQSLCKLGAYEDDELVGLVRLVGDGQTIVFIQDVLVHPDHQRKGIGTALIKEVLNRYGHVRQIQLITDETAKTLAFYQSLGFIELNEINCTGFMIFKK